MTNTDSRPDGHAAPWPRERERRLRPVDHELELPPPLTDDVEVPPQQHAPSGGVRYLSAGGPKASTKPGEIWLYASGGGIRSPQATLGAAWYLDHIDHWKYVTRIVSVSGGSLTNAEFAARARRGATGDVDGKPGDFVGDFHRRLSTPHRWVFLLLVIALVVAAIGWAYLMWLSSSFGEALASSTEFRVALVVASTGAILYLLWRRANGSARTVFRYVLWIVAVIAVGWVTIGGVGALPRTIRLPVIAAASAPLLVLFRVLAGRSFGNWLLVVVGVVSGMALSWYVLWIRGERIDWHWLEWILTLLLRLGFIWGYLAVVQIGVVWMLKYRIDKMLEQPTRRQPDELDEIDSGLVHVFSTADYCTGNPTYLTAGPHTDPDRRATAIHDVSTSSNAIRFYDASHIRVRDAVYDSVALPGLVWLQRRKLPKVEFGDDEAPSPIPKPERCKYGDSQFAPSDTTPIARAHPKEQTFALMDGGLNSTFSTKLDPLLAGLVDEPGTMGAIDVLYPTAAMIPPLLNQDIRRIIVDAGKYLDESGRTGVSSWIGLNALFSIRRGLDIANLSLLESDRQLADRVGSDIWYLPTTGGHRAFSLRFNPSAIALLVGEHRATPTNNEDPDQLRDLLLAGEIAWFDGEIDDELRGIAQSVSRVLHLKKRADKISLATGQAEYGYDALASGAASTFVEHRGIEADPHGLEKMLFELDEDLLQDVPNVLFGTTLPLVISHQGLRKPGERGNTAVAFWRALDAGFTMLEVDVMVTRDGKLMAQHPGELPGTSRQISARDARRRTLAAWRVEIPDLVELRQLLHPVPYAAELFENDLDAESKAATLSTAVWNIEAKDRRSAIAVSNLLDDLSDKTELPDIFFSGGWKVRPLRAFRSRQEDVATACDWLDALRLVFGFRADEAAVLQVPAVDPASGWAMGAVIWLLKRVVANGRAQGKTILWFQIDHADEAILLRMTSPCHGFMSEGSHVMTWARRHYW